MRLFVALVLFLSSLLSADLHTQELVGNTFEDLVPIRGSIWRYSPEEDYAQHRVFSKAKHKNYLSSGYEILEFLILPAYHFPQILVTVSKKRTAEPVLTVYHPESFIREFADTNMYVRITSKNIDDSLAHRIRVCWVVMLKRTRHQDHYIRIADGVAYEFEAEGMSGHVSNPSYGTRPGRMADVGRALFYYAISTAAEEEATLAKLILTVERLEAALKQIE